MRKPIDNFKNFLLKENKYDIDDILDKINKSGINSLSFYEKKILENPGIQKKLLYQYNYFIKNTNADKNSAYVGKMEYTNKLKEEIKC
jgi:hypothetical protein